MMKRIGVVLLATTLIACGTELELEDHGDAAAAGAFDAPGEEQGLTRQCRPTETVKGIDVSYWQSQIDWQQVARDGVKYAFIRVSDGSTFIDPRFQENWAGARAAGIKRGVYQFFRSNRDPIEQANILLDQMGPLQPGDLPPVIDVESTDGQSKATIARKVAQWIDHVEARLGVKPIIYTGPYFWRDSVGSDAFADHPLWIAHYGTDCPLTPPPWPMWSFHQFTDRGRVAGIRGQVDTNHFAGTMADLEALSYQGDGTAPPPPSSSCANIPASGGVVDEEGACFTAGGPTQYLRAETGEGHSGGLVWTTATASAARENYGEWELRLEVPGRYRLQAFTDTSVATSQFARYRIEHDGVVETKQLDQRSVDGFRDLGTFTFTSGTARIVLNDNTGEAASQRKKLVFDALQVLPADDAPPPAPTPTCSRVRVTNADALNIRPTPSTSQAAVGSLRRGDVVDRLDSVDGQSVSGNRTWHKVTKGSVTGFVTSYYTACVD